MTSTMVIQVFFHNHCPGYDGTIAQIGQAASSEHLQGVLVSHIGLKTKIPEYPELWQGKLVNDNEIMYTYDYKTNE